MGWSRSGEINALDDIHVGLTRTKEHGSAPRSTSLGTHPLDMFVVPAGVACHPLSILTHRIRPASHARACCVPATFASAFAS
eukprot:5821310-Pyramimonas_sp.AAC.1